MMIAWVIGSGGLLGSALCRALRNKETELFSPAERFRWGNEGELASQLAAAVQAFAACVGAERQWEIYWAAGVGTMSSSEADLALETRVLSLLLRLAESEPQLMATPGAVAFASSAGAIYAGSSDYIISENSTPTPTTPYAREKLRQEELVRSFVLLNGRMAALIARLSTLYGPGQSFRKQQGLLAHIARCVLRHQPIQIYVPFDTIRDYIAADDAAAMMVAALRVINDKPSVLTKIIASEQPTTIAEIISVFKRIARRAPRIITSTSRLSSIYSHRVRFQSVAAPECVRIPKISLFIGISQVMSAERAALVRSPSDLLR
ncbi:MAG TPA: NAD-dependent epimerase/dehydratase family protein [Candidatus Competibacteraceae bacterium]|nr:NAD-dependent epimerase/dehydratase family protein [Candidatus Competibacteraceae bacterium]HRZ04982.1 NAD-dependent epimerase/dehydratase family protein [Candidatus Competibacteraceae bacterium]HSA45259.1 NAD-dependent epimerase/dehydratase family protein [Candidatus Competibacteraceae bacterium]